MRRADLALDLAELPTAKANPERRLAHAVILRALQDARGVYEVSTSERDGARRFLRNECGGLAYWCQLGDLKLATITRYARRQWPTLTVVS